MNKLLDTSYPLAEKFKSLAPGTFQHCLNVANLCETIAKELDLNIENIKLAAMYHDIGKIFNPQYFAENISDTNPHDNIDPHVSYQVLTRHVSDSVTILIQEQEMPREVLEIIVRHHGDTILQAIYNKCDKTKVQEHSYRYKTPKAHCTEACVLMIVDSIEAKARALNSAGKLETHDEKTLCVTSTIEYLREDQQLDEMKVGILRRIKQILVRELDSIYHARISYEKDE